MFPSFACTFYISFESRDGECPRRLDNGAGIIEDIFDCAANLIVVHSDDSLDRRLNDGKRVASHLPHGNTIGKQTRGFEAYRMPGPQGAIHCIGIDRLDPDHADLRHDGLHVGANAGDKPAPSHRHEDRCQVTRMLAHDFVGDRALTGDDQRIVERMDEDKPTFFGKPVAMKLSLRIVIAHEHNLRIERLDRFHFDIGRGFRHHDDGVYPEMLRGQSYTLRVIAGACGDHAGCPLSL